jgi:hypothetical protein
MFLRVRQVAFAAIVSASLAVGLVAAQAGSVFAYGKTAVYQVEISANQSFASGGGYGVWLWIELDSNGTGDYTGSDCGHNLDGHGSAGAVSDKGDVTWWTDGTNLYINGVVLNGVPPSGLPISITVPAAYGHSKTSLAAIAGAPLPGWVQLTVAP